MKDRKMAIKIIIDDFYTKNKGWTREETIKKADVDGEIEFHKYYFGREPERVYILPSILALSEKYQKSYYNNDKVMILMPR